MIWKSLRLRLWDPDGQRWWWPDPLFVTAAVLVSGWAITFRHSWALGIVAGAVVLLVDEVLYYVFRTRRREPTSRQ